MQYDTDPTTWSPQGRLFQVEYAMEAVKQGSAVVGARSKTHAVLAALRRSPAELAKHLEKVYAIDDHMGIAISGLTADARSLCKCVAFCLRPGHSVLRGATLSHATSPVLSLGTCAWSASTTASCTALR